MSDEQDRLRAAIGDLGALRQSLQDRANNLATHITSLKNRLARQTGGRRVSDHAVVRYLERVFGIDMERTRDDIRRLVDESTPFASCDGLWHSKGMVFILNDDGAVVTVLGEKEAVNYVGSRLVNGQKSEIGEGGVECKIQQADCGTDGKTMPSTSAETVA